MKFRKLCVSVLMILIVVCCLCACQSSGSQKKVLDESSMPELKIGVDTLKPYFFTDENGNYAGIDAEIATEACHRAGYTPVFVEINWNKKDAYLKDGTVDCLWNAFAKNGREKMYRWTDTYLQSSLRIIVDTRSPDKDINSIRGRSNVAVRSGSKAEEVLLENSNNGDNPLNVYSCGTFEMAETAFVKGYAGTLCCHEAVLEQVISNYPGLFRFLDGSIQDVDLGVAFSKKDTSDKCEKINDAINDMKKDGTIADISIKYRSDVSASEGKVNKHD